MGYQNVQKMKRDVDLVYFGSYIKISKLKDLKNAYTGELVNTILKSKNRLLSHELSISLLKNSREKIVDSWLYYKNSYKSEDELIFMDRVDKAINLSLIKIDIILDILKSKNQSRINSISYEKIFETVDDIDILIEALVVYESEKSHNIKKKINIEFEDSLYKMWLLMVFVLVLGFVVSIIVSRNIHISHKMLREKGEQLRDVNKLLTELSITDTLTKIYNRRYFDLLFERELKSCARDKRYFTFVMMDIDHFKQYNDNYGHGMGDEVLINVAKTLKSSLKRPTDYIFRLGGEEFGAIFIGLDRDKSLALAQKLLKTLEDQMIVHEHNSASKYITMSMGLKNLIPDASTKGKAIIESADEALYKAKESGRNRVVLA